MALKPRSPELLALVAEAGRNVARSAVLLEETIRRWPESRALVAEIRECEHEGDRITHDLLHVLPHSLVLPLPRDLAHQLAITIDDVVDYIEEAADHLELYEIEAPMEQAQALAGVLRDSARTLAAELDGLAHLKKKKLRAAAEELHRLERDGDHLMREGVAALFASGVDPLFVIRWKDIYERLEDGIDACDKVGHILTSISLDRR